MMARRPTTAGRSVAESPGGHVLSWSAGRTSLYISGMGAGPGRRADSAGETPLCAAFLAGRGRGGGVPLHVGLPHPLLCRRA